MEKKLIDLYKEWMNSGKLTDSGLCFSVPKEYKTFLELFKPLKTETVGLYSFLYWASQDNDSGLIHFYDFNPLRQTIVLLICAMNDEL